jgi:hypothetical protein
VARGLLVIRDVSKLFTLLVVVSACGFNPRTLEVQPDAQKPEPTPAPPPTGDAAQQIAACHSQLPGVVLCFDFESSSLDPTILDLSAGHHDASDSHVDPMTRLTQQAAMLSESSSITVPASPELDITGPVSIELWLDAAEQPDGTTILQHDDDFGVDFHHEPGCFINDSDDLWAPSWSAGWHHVGCTYDGTTLRTYVDGSVVTCANVGSPETVHSKPIDISIDYSGGLDDVHVYNRALAPQEMQLMAGVTSGSTECD